MIDEIDYFSKRDKYKKKKDSGLDEEWDALKKSRSQQDSKAKTMKKKQKSDPKEGDAGKSQKK